ncbi:lipocalin family protein [uncultured Pseudoteredinibacter sp.]|uniref:lipocalin family protein n=1 Tax=uncultured Pseudoteredinibacter sp. TaxID=1641701 RepID=UPI00260B6FAD|nr:lipocalin family protein [uncultured Pseudoteredinibacter sp.]
MTQRYIATILSITILSACQSHPPLKTVENLDLQRFMGDWYVIAHIPTWPERNASKAIESYHLNDDGSVDTVFTFTEVGDTKQKTMTATGFPDASSNYSIWGMQFFWPIKADYRVVYIDSDYQHTIVARNKRDYLWVMSRKPCISSQKMKELTAFSEKLGYDMSKLRQVPQ